MKIAHWCFSIISIVAALRAAYLWYRASEVPIEPAWKTETGENERNIMAWVTGTMQSVTASGRLNKRAAIWTAVSVLFSAIASAV